MLKIVVFPAPFGPMRPTSSCPSIDRLKSETAVRPPNRIVTFLTSRSGMATTPHPPLRGTLSPRERDLVCEPSPSGEGGRRPDEGTDVLIPLPRLALRWERCLCAARALATTLAGREVPVGG